MSKRITGIIEIVAMVLLLLLAMRWAWTQEQSVEPYTVMCGCVLAGLEFYRRKFAGDKPTDNDTQYARSVTEKRISDKARELLISAAKDGHGLIMIVRTTAGLFVQANKRQFAESKNPRSEAEWKAAVEELQQHRLIEDMGEGGMSFQVTLNGYSAVDSFEAAVTKKRNSK
jgi:hypothetical protein